METQPSCCVKYSLAECTNKSSFFFFCLDAVVHIVCNESERTALKKRRLFLQWLAKKVRLRPWARFRPGAGTGKPSRRPQSARRPCPRLASSKLRRRRVSGKTSKADAMRAKAREKRRRRRQRARALLRPRALSAPAKADARARGDSPAPVPQNLHTAGQPRGRAHASATRELGAQHGSALSRLSNKAPSPPLTAILSDIISDRYELVALSESVIRSDSRVFIC